MTRCKNCETEFAGNFCPQCGQKNVDLERPLSELLAEVVREAFDVDGRAIRTLWTLFRRPGVLTGEFLAGRRKLYSPPFRLYLVISLVFFVIAAWVAGQGILLNDGQTLEADAAGQERFFSDQVPRLMFVLLPLERVAASVTPAMIIQLLLLGCLVTNFVISVHHVYRTSWFAAAGKSAAIFIAYMMVVAGLFEAASYLTSAGLPYLTD